FDTGQENAGIRIIITEIYTPFQFWFRFDGYIDEVINKLSGDLYEFYNQSSRHSLLNKQLYGHIVEFDHEESIAFMRISQNENMSPSINKQMVEAKLAGESDHYTKKMREFHCGRRIRYMRERLPSFDMLENGCYPMWGEDFEQKFDDIINDPEFYVNYQPPKIKNPFLWRLEKALESWLVKYKEEEEVWRQLYKEANVKLLKENEQHVQKIMSASKAVEGKDNNG
ncbi:uncharacterized protein Dwil_GK14609, partial [Drosophila willistoni]